MEIDLLIFDLDGTLIDSKYDLADALNYTAMQLGYKAIPESQIPQLVGNGVRALIRSAFQLNDNSVELYDAQTILMDYYRHNLTTRTTFYPQVLDTIQFFSQKKKAILSNKPDEFTQKVVHNMKLKPHFDLVLGANDKFARKPSGEALLHILNELNVAPNKVLMIGDGDADVLAGKDAGVNTCAVTYGYRSRSQLMALSPDFIVDSFADIKELVS